MATPTITPSDVSTPEVINTGITSSTVIGGPSSVGDASSGVSSVVGAPGATDPLIAGLDVSLIPTAYGVGPAPAGNPNSSGQSATSTIAGSGGGTGAGSCDSSWSETLKDLLSGGWSNLSSCEKSKVYLWAIVFVVVLVLLRLLSKAGKGIL